MISLITEVNCVSGVHVPWGKFSQSYPRSCLAQEAVFKFPFKKNPIANMLLCIIILLLIIKWAQLPLALKFRESHGKLFRNKH